MSSYIVCVKQKTCRVPVTPGNFGGGDQSIGATETSWYIMTMMVLIPAEPLISAHGLSIAEKLVTVAHTRSTPITISQSLLKRNKLFHANSSGEAESVRQF